MEEQMVREMRLGIQRLTWVHSGFVVLVVAALLFGCGKSETSAASGDSPAENESSEAENEAGKAAASKPSAGGTTNSGTTGKSGWSLVARYQPKGSLQVVDWSRDRLLLFAKDGSVSALPFSDPNSEPKKLFVLQEDVLPEAVQLFDNGKKLAAKLYLRGEWVLRVADLETNTIVKSLSSSQTGVSEWILYPQFALVGSRPIPWSLEGLDAKKLEKAKKVLQKTGIAVDSGWYVLAQSARGRTVAVDIYSGAKVKLRGHDSMYSVLWSSAQGPVVLGGAFGARRWTVTELSYPGAKPKKTKAKYLYKSSQGIYRFQNFGGIEFPDKLIGSRLPEDAPGTFQFLAFSQETGKRKNVYTETLLASVAYKANNLDNVHVLTLDTASEQVVLHDGKYFHRVSLKDGKSVEKKFPLPKPDIKMYGRILTSPDGKDIVAVARVKDGDKKFNEVYRVKGFLSWFDSI
jgi:hypothetical protein